MKAILIILIFATVSFGQTAQEKITKLNPKAYKVIYDKFKDRTNVVTANNITLNAKGKTLLGVGIETALSFSGTEPKNDAAYFLAFSALSGNWRLIEIRTAILLVDGSRIDLTGGERDSNVKTMSYWGLAPPTVYVNERIMFPLPVEVLTQLAKAKRVEFQLGRIEGVANDKTMAGFKDLLGLTAK